MPIDKVREKKSKKVKSISSKDLNADGTVKVMSTQERKKEHDARMRRKAQEEKAEREAATAERNRIAREAEVRKNKALLEAKKTKTVADLTSDDGPQTIATCVARALGLEPTLKPKQVVDQALDRVMGLTVDEAQLPKAQLLQIAAVLAEKARAAAADKAAKAAAKKAKVTAKAEEAAAAKEAVEAEARAAKEEAAAQRLAQREAAAAAGGEPAEGSEGSGGAARKLSGGRKASRKDSGKTKMTKEQKEIAKRMEGTGKQIAREIALLEQEMRDARTTAAMARIRGGGGQQMGPIDTGEFSLPNPGGGPDLLDKASLLLVPGKRYGLIGRNGRGKSTLLKALAARRVGGFKETLSIHYISQTSAEMGDDDEALPADVVLRADVERSLLDGHISSLEGKLDADIELTDEESALLSDCHERMAEIDGDSAHVRVTALLKNLGFSDELLARPIRALSGGWRVRVALGAGLFAAPDVLLLDEPTNHLSIEAVLWLAHELSTSPVWADKVMIMVSHDRSFLDAVCTDSLHLSGAAKRVTQERGNYSTWFKRRVAKKKAFDQKCKARQMDIAHLKEFIGRGGTYTNVSIQRKMKEEQVAKLLQEEADDQEAMADLQDDIEFPITIHCSGKLDVPPIKVSDVGFAYPGMAKPLFRHAEVCVESGSRLVLLGENGRGKTTLVKLMLGELEPTEGVVHRNSGARIALVNQHHGDQIDLDMTALDYLCAEYKKQHVECSREVVEQMRGHLTSCGIDDKLQIVRGRAMSGGQRSRLAMAAVSFLRPHVLILDEPTNNLDVESVEALATSIKNFEGGVVMVSHDQHFVSQVANEVWVIDHGAVTRQPSFEHYLKEASKAARKAAAAS